jgi:hypothetical protein
MQHTIYDRYRPEVDIDVRSLKTTDEPSGISPRRQETTAVSTTEFIGIFVLSETLLQIRQPGTPRSREKAPNLELGRILIRARLVTYKTAEMLLPIRQLQRRCP